MNILILGASYGSLLGTKLAMAGHNVVLVCRKATADLINSEGTEVRIKLRNEVEHRKILSTTLPGGVSAAVPENCNPMNFDLVVLAMQEPQYGHKSLQALMTRIGESQRPCLSLMNMPPLAFLKRLGGLDLNNLARAYSDPEVWDNFNPEVVSLCSPDPQAFRPPNEATNVLHVGLPTNFKCAPFGRPAHDALLRSLEADISAVRLDGKDVPVKLRVFDSLCVPMAKWSMLLAGNYRCVTGNGLRSISQAVNDDLEKSREIYLHVDKIARVLGATDGDLVPFEKYAKAAEGLLKPSSAARAVIAGAAIERVDKLVQLISQDLGLPHAEIDRTVALVDAALDQYRVSAA